MTLRRLAPLALILGGLSLTQTGCMAAAKVGGKAVVATGKAIIPGDSDKNDLADRREEE